MFSYMNSTASAAAVEDTSMRAPTALQLHNLTALTAGTSAGSSRSGRARGHSKLTKLAKDGETIAKFWNIVAGRPYPAFTTLDQSITVSLFMTGNGFTTSASSTTVSSEQFNINACPGVSSYTSLFDQYMIRQVEVWIAPTGSQEVGFGDVATCVDLDDANAAPSYAAVADHQGALFGNSASGRYHRFMPHVAVAAYSGTFASFSNEPACWIDCASPSVQHYGLKIFAAIAPVAVTYAMSVRLIVSFRAPGIA
jgi:hypothetical protein